MCKKEADDFNFLSTRISDPQISDLNLSNPQKKVIWICLDMFVLYLHTYKICLNTTVFS
jgi:hypothetical protein